MARLAGDLQIPGQDGRMKGATRHRYDLRYRGKVTLSGQDRVELSPAATRSDPEKQFGIIIGVKKSGEGADAHLLFDLSSLEPGVSGGYRRLRATGLPFPLMPNAWQQLVDWRTPHHGGRPIWCYLESTATPATPPPRELSFGNDPTAPYRLDVIYGDLPEATTQKLHLFGPEHARLTVERMGGWFSYSLVCLSGKSFNMASGAGEYAKIGHEDYHDRRLGQLRGTLVVHESSLSLKCEFSPPAPRKKDTTLIPFEGEVRPGEWKLHRIAGGPTRAMIGPVPGGPPVFSPGSPAMNTAAFRVTKLSPPP